MLQTMRAVTLAVACVSVALSMVGRAAATAQPEDGFRPLFNGRDLSGWVDVNCAPETWSVRDGMIYSTGRPICELRTERMYENFILELEYRHLEPLGNAGVFIWGDALTARGQPFVRAIEVQVLDGRNTETYTSHGDVFSIHGATMTPDRPHPKGAQRSLPSERRARPAGEWNHYRITAKDGTIKLAVNGKEVSGGYDISPRKGYIHLESEGGVVQWRNLKIRELPSAGALTPDQVAREDEGFENLYTGLDFRNWRYAEAHQDHWAPRDWIISYDGKASGSASTLSTERTFGDVSVIADWRIPSGSPGRTLPLGIGSVELPDEARTLVERALEAQVPGDKPQWHRAMLTRQGGRLTLALDGEVVFRDVAVPGASQRGPITLQPGAQAIEFANLFVRERR